jgi:CheY-like chemotaxis protein
MSMSKGRVIVVVDDEPDLRNVLCEMLEDDGYEVISLSRPSRVLELEPEEMPTVFLLDLMLPGMSGIELAGRIREGPFAGTSIIAISASAVMLRLATESGLFNATMQKPFDIDDLLGSVRTFAA